MNMPMLPVPEVNKVIYQASSLSMGKDICELVGGKHLNPFSFISYPKMQILHKGPRQRQVLWALRAAQNASRGRRRRFAGTPEELS
jgi:hypothetical protein